jgi:DnaJ like chaperone protein
MNRYELIFIFVCALLGYVFTSWLLKKKTPTSRDDARQRGHDGRQQNNEDPLQDNQDGNYDFFRNEDIATTWFNILGVPESASKEQITTGYKKMISQYHPDKVARLGVEIRELSESKTKKINAAYSYAKSLRG